MCKRNLTVILLLLVNTFSFADKLPKAFQWNVSPPLIAPAESESDFYFSIKDPTVVQYDGKWHLFCTVRGKNRTHQIEYLSLSDWNNPKPETRAMLTFNDGYYCAPQVFFFTPHKKWYLLHQAAHEGRKPGLQPAFSTTGTIANPLSWSKPGWLFDEHPSTVSAWIDFWIICDDEKAHLFFTSLNGKMWRCETPLADFPHGWTLPQVVLEAGIFEASHTYKIKDEQLYLTVVEAQYEGKRYYKAYIASTLDGEWIPAADRYEIPFASPHNSTFTGEHWTDSYSHGELLRVGYDEKMEIDPANLRFLFQGVAWDDMKDKIYGEIPWRLGLLLPRAMN